MNPQSPDDDSARAADFDPAAAANLMHETERRVGESFDVRPAAQYLAWGLAWLIGLGAMWITVLGQRPYRGAESWTTLLLVLLLAAALVVTAMTTARATTGLGGTVAFRGQIFGAAWGIGFIAFWFGMYALSIHGARSETMSYLAGAGSMGLTGLIYLLGSGLWLDRLMMWLGGWLLIVAIVGIFGSPVWLLGVGAIAGGGGFLVAAAIAWRRRGR